MIKKFLKIAGVKNEQEFYKKYPTEAAFFKAHPEAKGLKKNKMGGELKKLNQLTSYDGDIDGIQKAQGGLTIPTIPGINDMSLAFGNAPNIGGNSVAGGLMTVPQTSMMKLDPNMTGTFAQQVANTNNIMGGVGGADVLGKLGGVGGLLNIGSKIGGAIEQMKEEKKQRKRAERDMKVSGLTLQAASLKPEQQKRKYVRPEDVVFNPEEMYPTYGTGYSPGFAARDGAMIGGNPTEIQNTYAPGTVYDDLGYSPLNDTNVKQYQLGGGITSDFTGNLGSYIGSMAGGVQGGTQTGAGQLGSTIGGALGNFIPIPGVGGMIGSTVGGVIGGMIGSKNVRKTQEYNERTKQNLEQAGMMSTIQGMQSQYGANMRYGGIAQDGSTLPPELPGVMRSEEEYLGAMDAFGQIEPGTEIKRKEQPTAQPASKKQLKEYEGVSVVDFLSAQGKASDYASRKELAKSLGIEGYRGTADQNLKLIDMIKDNPEVLDVYPTSKSSSKSPSRGGSPKYAYTDKETGKRYTQSDIDAINKGFMSDAKKAITSSKVPDVDMFAVKGTLSDVEYAPVNQPVIQQGRAKFTGKSQKVDPYIRMIEEDPQSEANINYEKRKDFATDLAIGTLGPLAAESALMAATTRYLPYGLRAIPEVTAASRHASRALPNATRALPPSTSTPTGWSTVSGLRSSGFPLYEEGGYVSHDWQPQVIAKFGEYDVNELLTPDPMMDTLRAGGHIVAQKGKSLLPSNPSGYADSVIRANPSIQYYKDVLANKAPEVSDFPGMFSETEIRGMDDSNEKNPYVGARTSVKPYLSYVNGKYTPIEGMYEAYQDKTIPSLDFPSQYAARVFEEEMKKRTTKHRTGGHIRQNHMFPTDKYAFGGDLKTHWGGYAEPISYNPYLGSETVMFRGQSHDESDGTGRTGIGITYGENPVEVERNEPAIKMKDGSSGSDSLVVYGDLKINNASAEEIGDSAAKGMKFKHYVRDLSKNEAKQNKLVDKSINTIDSLDMLTPYDKLKMSSAMASLKGAGMKLKDIADKKMNAAAVQNAINDTAEEYGWKASDLAVGKVTPDSEYSEIAQDGKKIKKSEVAGYLKDGYVQDPNNPNRLVKKGSKTVTIAGETTTSKGVSKTAPRAVPGGTAGEAWKRKIKNLLNQGVSYDELAAKGHGTVGGLKKMFPGEYKEVEIKTTTPDTTRIENFEEDLFVEGEPAAQQQTTTETTPAKKGQFNWGMLASGLMPYIRPSDVEAFDYSAVYPEMLALATNQLEPVPAQTIQPLLEQPYDISLQDQINEVTAQTRAAERMVGNNPAALANIASQANLAKSKVLGEQMRINQAQRAGVYARNRQAINQAALQNLNILDQQYVRQAQAKSATKATALEAVKSISDKVAKNKLENRTLATYENLYNYRYDPKFRAINWNAPYQFNRPQVGESPVPYPPLATNPYSQNKKTSDDEKEETGKYGLKTGKKKNLNSSIVKAFKNI
jgi:hypothetical protein